MKLYLLLGVAAALFSFARPAVASTDPSSECRSMALLEVAVEMGSAARFPLSGPIMAGIEPITARLVPDRGQWPDAAIVLAWPDQPLFVALTSGGCLVAAFRIERRALWDALRQGVGPAI